MSTFLHLIGLLAAIWLYRRGSSAFWQTAGLVFVIAHGAYFVAGATIEGLTR